jgi:hypothetical protein
LASRIWIQINRTGNDPIESDSIPIQDTDLNYGAENFALKTIMQSYPQVKSLHFSFSNVVELNPDSYKLDTVNH